MIALSAARPAFGRELGPYGVYTASSGSTTTAVVAAAFQSSELPTDSQAYTWVLSPAATAPRQRRVTLNGLTPGSGTLTFDAALGTAVGAGTVIELSPLLPPIHESSANVGAAGYLSLHGCLNLGLRHLLIPHTILLPLVSGQHDYDLSSYTFLDSPARLTDVWEPNALGTNTRPTRKTWAFVESADGHQLQFEQPYRFSTGSYNLELHTLRPADTWITVSGVAADSTVGLLNESDETVVDLNTLIRAAKPFAYRALRDKSSGSMKATYEALRQEALDDARKIRHGMIRWDDGSDESAAPAGPEQAA